MLVGLGTITILYAVDLNLEQRQEFKVSDTEEYMESLLVWEIWNALLSGVEISFPIYPHLPCNVAPR